jgi:hypothetical protein
MPKKPPRQEAKESQLVAWYKWEFLRRNVEYRKDYEEFVRECGEWFEEHGYWYDQATEPWGQENLRYFETVIAPKAKLLCERWEIRDPFSPDWEFTPSGEYEYRPGWRASLPTDCSKEEAGGVWDFSELSFSSRELRKRLREYKPGPAPDYRLTLKFDLRSPLVDLLRRAKDELKSGKANYDRRHTGPAKSAPSVRRRLNRYKVYLEVWDRRSHRREKFLSIAADLFGSGPKDEQRAKDSFSRAQALINGGYKELR